ncbi:hypothetical protein ACH5RR_001919 [Cinchona calisaya]|uniref:Serine-threonine/tyrosine-protein kinase catalytic domain-containing protein n=1 Tax=Cinchona calisaya TaxID=153742 RepID=A0ABD3B4W0_9GENT
MCIARMVVLPWLDVCDDSHHCKIAHQQGLHRAAKDWMTYFLPYITNDDKPLFVNIMDPSLIMDEHLFIEVWAVAIIAKACLSPEPSESPQMTYILEALQNAKFIRLSTLASPQSGAVGPSPVKSRKPERNKPGVPKLKRSELHTAWEDFSNVIGSSSAGTSYKRTLSGGVEIIDTLSKVDHKNFENLLGYCEEEEPFRRMMVFDPQELEFLGNSSVLTEDYAAKISDFSFWNEVATVEMESNPQSNVYSFGVLLFEIVTGRLPYSVGSSPPNDWASDYLGGEQPLRDMVDPTLNSFQDEQLERIDEIMRSCVHPNPSRRPEMREVTARLREKKMHFFLATLNVVYVLNAPKPIENDEETLANTHVRQK